MTKKHSFIEQAGVVKSRYEGAVARMGDALGELTARAEASKRQTAALQDELRRLEDKRRQAIVAGDEPTVVDLDKEATRVRLSLEMEQTRAAVLADEINFARFELADPVVEEAQRLLEGEGLELMEEIKAATAKAAEDYLQRLRELHDAAQIVAGVRREAVMLAASKGSNIDLPPLPEWLPPSNLSLPLSVPTDWILPSSTKGTRPTRG